MLINVAPFESNMFMLAKQRINAIKLNVFGLLVFNFPMITFLEIKMLLQIKF